MAYQVDEYDHTTTTSVQKPERQLNNSTQPMARYDERVFKTQEDIFNVIGYTRTREKQCKIYILSSCIHLHGVVPTSRERTLLAFCSFRSLNNAHMMTKIGRGKIHTINNQS